MLTGFFQQSKSFSNYTEKWSLLSFKINVTFVSICILIQGVITLKEIPWMKWIYLEALLGLLIASYFHNSLFVLSFAYWWTQIPLQYSHLENPWTEEPGGLQRESTLAESNFTFTFHVHALEKEMATHSSVLAWRIPGTGEPGGLPPMGSHRAGHNWSNLAAAAADTNKTQTQYIHSKWLPEYGGFRNTTTKNLNF